MDKRYLFKFFYIGSENYYGSQRQNNLETIEDCLINGLTIKGYIKDAITSSFEVASRTDKLVSARGSAFSCGLEREPILMEINSALPRDIGIWGFTEVPDSFLSRYNAIFRHYKYLLPLYYFKDGIGLKFNLTAIRRGCKLTNGRHDFKNFSKSSPNVEEKTLRDLSLSVIKEGSILIFDFKSRAFLRQQIRKIMAKIIELGKSEINLKEYSEILDPTKEFSFPPADPNGLILWDVSYGKNLKFNIDQKSLERLMEYMNNNYLYHTMRAKLFDIFQQDNFSQ
jgi:tRNA pseudouridine38-40 synthase